MASKEDLARFLTLAGIAGTAACLFWWFVFYSRVIAFTGGGARDFSQVFECLFYSSVQCVIVKGISSLAGYWPYDPFFFWLSGGAFAGGIVLRSTLANGGASEPIFAPPRRADQPKPTSPISAPSINRASASERWLVSSILSNGQILKFEINETSPRKIIGRGSPQVDVIIADDSVSRTHACIEMRDGALWINDFASINGTKVGGRAVGTEPQRLYPSDKVLMGVVVLTISTA